MGRELGIHQIDFLKDGSAIIRHSDYNLCGRTEFTNDITSLFYRPDSQVNYLLVSKENYPFEGELSKVYKVHVKVEDDYWSEKEFVMEYSKVSLKRILEICSEHANKDARELERERAMMEDARIARQHTTTLKDFEDFSELLDSLQEHYDEFCEEALDYSNELNMLANIPSTIDKDAIKTGILLTYSE